jgi:cob(I)alamin adenosyltransferase
MNFIPLNVSLDEKCMSQFIRRYHFNDNDKKEIDKLCRQLTPRVHAEFHYCMTDDTFKDAGKVAAVVMTLGTAFDELQDSFIKKGDIHRAYIVDCLGIEIMSIAYDRIDEKLHELTGLYAGGYIFTGSDELPLSETPRLMSLLGQKVITYNESFVLMPKKSVLFEVPLYGNKVEKHDRCVYCSAVNCQYRKAEYFGGKAAEVREEVQPGLIHLYTGEGKGKTTASIGLSIRAAGAGKNVVFCQFMKGRDTSELNILSALPTVTIVRSDEELGWFKNGDPGSIAAFTELHNSLLDEIEELIGNGKCDLLVLDEVTYPINYGIIDISRLEKLIASKPEEMEIVLTGRNAPDFMRDKADYITEMSKVRHPYDKGIQARRGIEY